MRINLSHNFSANDPSSMSAIRTIALDETFKKPLIYLATEPTWRLIVGCKTILIRCYGCDGQNDL